jgi:hypothetical protein
LVTEEVKFILCFFKHCNGRAEERRKEYVRGKKWRERERVREYRNRRMEEKTVLER